MLRLFAISLLSYAYFLQLQMEEKKISPPLQEEIFSTAAKSPLVEEVKAEVAEASACPLSPESLSKEIYGQLGFSSVPKFREKEEIKIALIDTGIDLKNPILMKSVIVPEKGLGEYNFTKDSDLMDHNGHATHVAGIILGLYPKAKLMPLKFYTNRKSFNLVSQVNALKYAIKAKVDIINLSVEGPDFDEEEKALMLQAKKQGILVVVAAGNNRKNLNTHKSWPASLHLSNMIVVGNHDHTMKRWQTSNYGEKTVDVFALGTDVLSLNVSSRYEEEGCLSSYTGTSMAVPFVVGFAAVLKDKFPNYSNKEIRKILLDTATYTPFLSAFSAYGHLEPYRIMNYEPNRNVSSEIKKSQK